MTPTPTPTPEKQNALALITGAGGGIGSAISRALAARNFDLALGWAHNEEAVRTLAAELSAEFGVNACPVRIDLSDVAGISEACESAVRTAGRGREPNVLINNGGSAHIGLFQLMTEAELLRLMNTDLIGAMVLTKCVLPAMIRRQSGRIVNIASVWGEVGGSCETAYSAAKAGLIGFTRALAREVAPSGVRVNCVSPGFIDTPMNGQLTPDERRELIEQIPCSRAGTPEDVAAAVSFLVSEGADYVCGQVLRVDGGWV